MKKAYYVINTWGGCYDEAWEQTLPYVFSDIERVKRLVGYLEERQERKKASSEYTYGYDDYVRTHYGILVLKVK